MLRRPSQIVCCWKRFEVWSSVYEHIIYAVQECLLCQVLAYSSWQPQYMLLSLVGLLFVISSLYFLDLDTFEAIFISSRKGMAVINWASVLHHLSFGAFPVFMWFNGCLPSNKRHRSLVMCLYNYCSLEDTWTHVHTVVCQTFILFTPDNRTAGTTHKVHACTAECTHHVVVEDDVPYMMTWNDILIYIYIYMYTHTYIHIHMHIFYSLFYWRSLGVAFDCSIEDMFTCISCQFGSFPAQSPVNSCLRFFSSCTVGLGARCYPPPTSCKPCLLPCKWGW